MSLNDIIYGQFDELMSGKHEIIKITGWAADFERYYSTICGKKTQRQAVKYCTSSLFPFFFHHRISQVSTPVLKYGKKSQRLY